MTETAYIQTPAPDNHKKVTNLSAFLGELETWQQKQQPEGKDDGFLGQLWYRGVKHHSSRQAPGVYRQSFTGRASRLKLKRYNDIEAKRLHLEREMIAQFRVAGAAFLKNYTPVEIYFAAQHFGMPTRLLDWSTNPLAALFFACDSATEGDGAVYAMNAKRVIPTDARKVGDTNLARKVMTMRHTFVEYAVDLSFWGKVKTDHGAHILPVRPDHVPGRIGQQGSCFTLHMHKAPPVKNKTLITIPIDEKSKGIIRKELERVGINQFTIYYDLDHLSKEIRRGWGIKDQLVWEHL